MFRIFIFKNITNHIGVLKNPRNDIKIIQIEAQVSEIWQCLISGGGHFEYCQTWWKHQNLRLFPYKF